MINELVIVEQVNNRRIPYHPETVQEENNDGSKSYQGPEQPKVQKNDEPRGYCRYNNFTTCKSSSFNRK